MSAPPQQRILVVEDDPAINTLFSELLAGRRVEVVVVESAEAGLEAIATGSFDLVVTDKNLPGLSGLELIRRLKAEDPHVEVILMTAFADMQSALAAFEHGVYDYLVKPFDSIEEVTRKIDRALEKRRLGQENIRLVAHLTAANARIEAMNRGLEGEVRTRTAELQAANERLAELTLTDDVTGLYNQRFLYRRLEEELQRVRRYRVGLALIMLDLDLFKRVNDGHDHLFGSRVLRRVGAVVQRTVRSTDMVVRYGGDEFVIILPHTDLEAATVVAERVRATLEETDVGDDAAVDSETAELRELEGATRYPGPFSVTASLGVAALAGAEAGPRALLQAADRGLYLAKQNGRNQVCLGAPEPGEP